MPHKYHAKPTTVDGIRFASMAEAKRYGELKLLEKAGVIEGLELQPKFALRTLLTTGTFQGAGRAMAGEYPLIGHYIADFRYFRQFPAGWVVEDVKGFDVPLGRWKRKHAELQYGITIVVIGRQRHGGTQRSKRRLRAGARAQK